MGLELVLFPTIYAYQILMEIILLCQRFHYLCKKMKLYAENTSHLRIMHYEVVSSFSAPLNMQCRNETVYKTHEP